MNTIKTKSYFSSRQARIAVLMTLLMSSLSSMAYDFEVTYSGKPMYFNFIGGDEVCITYKDTTFNSYDGNYTDEDVDFFDMQIVNLRCMAIPETVTHDNKTYRVTAIGENAFRECTKIKKIRWKNEPIKVIGANAFKGCTNLKYMDLPIVLETIGAHAFEDCTSLHYIEVPESVKSIEDYAFQNCSSLKWMYLFSALTIGHGAFHNAKLSGHSFSEGVAIFCPTLTPPIVVDSTAFDDSHYNNSFVKVLYSRAEIFETDENWHRFAHITRLNHDFKTSEGIFYRVDNDREVSIVAHDGSYHYGLDVDIPSTADFDGKTYTLTNIDNQAFVTIDCNNITIPNTVKRIGRQAFQKSYINGITIGDSVEVVGFGAFNESEVREIHFPKSVKEIGAFALLNTPELTSITVEEGNLVYDSREDCNALIHTATNRLIAGSGNTIIPTSVTAIADSAFYGNQRLKEITIPSNISRIGHYTFMGCGQLTNVTFSESLKLIGACAFTGNINLTSVVIPNSVDSIYPLAFLWCEKLQKVTLGSGLKYMGDGAFGYNPLTSSAMDSVICYATTPPQMEAACFEGNYDRATLLVPQASLELYKNDPNWSQFYKIVAIESSGIGEIPVDDGAPRERYNLQGQPVGDDYRGIVIENGKKILVE